MPLVAVASLTFAAGLLTGLGGLVFSGAGVLVALLAIAALRRDAIIAALGVVAGVGVLLGAARRRADASCLERARSRSSAAVRLGAAARPGALAWGTMSDGGCGVRVSLQVARGAAGEGALVVVRGQMFRQGGRLLMRNARIATLRAPGTLARTRARLGTTIDSVFGQDAPLARALIIADQRAIARDLRARYADAGIVHLLSVSGLHVAVIAAVVESLLLALRVSRRTACVASLALTAVYVAVIGAPPPAMRAATMYAASAVSRLAQRPTSPWAGLALGAVVPLLLDPATVLDVGWQLSVVGMAALIASGALAERVVPHETPRWARHVAAALLVSFVASVATLPIIAWSFGRVSLVAPLTNLVVGPIYGVLQPMLFLAVALSPAAPLAHFVAGAAHAPIVAADAVATLAARVALAAIDVSPTLVETLLLGALAVAVLVASASERPGAPLIAVASALVALAWAPLASREGGMLEVHMLDVGQGDAIALRTPRGRWILVDAGRTWRGRDGGRETVIPYVRRRGGEVAAFVLTHPHADHVGGAASVLRALSPALFVDAGYVVGNAAYREALVVAQRARVPWRRARPRDSLVIDGVTLELLAPDSAYAATLDDPNAASTVIRARFGAVRVLLVGDAERAEEAWLLAHEGERLGAEVLKVGHHGSRTSSTDAFLDAVRPRIALVSVGAGNGYGHPSAETLARLAERGAYILRSDQVGTAVVRTDGRRIVVDVEGGTWQPFDHDSAR